MKMRTIKIKQVATVFLTVMMAVIFTFENPMKIFSASVDTFSLDDYTPEQLAEMIEEGSINTKKKLYVSDLMIATGESEEEAKKILHDAGYIVYNANMMKGAGRDNPWVDLDADLRGDAYTSYYTYIGYKLTENKEEGITGISAMDQEGGYDGKFNYRDFLQKGLPGFAGLVSGLQAICKEFKARYDAGERAAIVAKRRLDLFCVPETSALTTGTPLGDYLLDPNRTEKEFEDMILILNGLVLNIINDELSMAISDSYLKETQAYKGYTHNTTWLTDAIDKVAASPDLSTIGIAKDLYWTDLENRFGEEAENLIKSYTQDADDTARNYLSTLSIDLTIGDKTYRTVKSFIENAPTRAIALYASFLPKVCREGRFADILNRFAAAPDDGIPSGFYNSSQAVVSYVSLADNMDWIRKAYEATNKTVVIGGPGIVDADNLEIQKKYAAQLITFRQAAEDGTLSDEAVNYLKEISLDGKNAYDLLNTCTVSWGSTFFYSMSVDSWVPTAYKAVQDDPELANIDVEDSAYWIDLQNRYADKLNEFRRAAKKGTLSAEVKGYLEGTGKVFNGKNAYDWLNTCSVRLGCAFLAAFEKVKSNTACVVDRYFIDMLEVCASDYMHRLPTMWNLDPYYQSEWAQNIVNSINANPYNSTTEKALYDKAQDIKEEINNFRDLLKTYIDGYKTAKSNMDKTQSVGIDILSPTQSDQLLEEVLTGKVDVNDVKTPDLYYVALAQRIDRYKLYDNTSLLDYLIQINDAFTQQRTSPKGYALAYPIVSALTEGQRYVYKTRSFLTFLLVMTLGEFEIELVAQHYDWEKNLLETGFGEGPVTIWYGSNKDLLEIKSPEFLAITNDELRRAAASDKLKLLWDNPPKSDLCYKILQTVSQVLGGVAGVAFVVIQVMGGIAGVGFFAMLGSAITAVFTTAGISVTAAATSAIVATCISTAMLVLVVVVIIVLAVIAIVYLVLYLKEHYSTSYSAQPTVLLDCQTTGGENSQIITESIVKYYAVRGPDGKPADANGFHGKKWTTLYYTKDTRLGSPLTVGPKGEVFFDNMGGVVTQSDARPIAKFGQDYPFNMNTNCFEDHVNGHYFWYYTEESMHPAEDDDDDTTSPKYIRDIILTYARDPSEAKLAIERLSGYKIFDENLSIDNEDFCTYLGYRTTNDPDYALTDIRVSYASASPQVMYGGATYYNVQPSDLQTVPTKTCAESSWRRENTPFSYGVYISTDSLVGDPILADSLAVVTSIDKIPAGKQVISMFCGGAFDFDSWDHEGYDTFGKHKFMTYKTEVQTTESETTESETTESETTESKTTESKTTEEETYIAGFAFMSGTKDWPGGTCAEWNMYEYAKSLGYTILEWWDPSVGYMNEGSETYLMYITTHDPKRAITDIGMFSTEPKSTSLPDSITTAMGGYSVCQIYTQGGFNYYGMYGDRNQRWMRPSHAYLTGEMMSEVNHYSIDGKDAYGNGFGDSVLGPDGEYMTIRPTGLRVLSRGLYVAGPVAGKEPLRLSDVIFTKMEGALPCDGGLYNGRLFSLKGEGSKTTFCAQNIGTGWKSVHPLDQYYYDTYDAKGNITSSYNLSDDNDSRRLYIFYKDGTPNRARGNYVSNVEIVGDRTKNASYNTARQLAMAYGTDILNLTEPIRVFTDAYWDPTTEQIFYSDRDFASIKYSDGCIYVTVTYTDDPDLALGSIRVLQEDENGAKLQDSYKMPLENSDTKVVYKRGEVVAPFFAPPDEDDDEKKSEIGSSSGKVEATAVSGIVVYKTTDGFKTNRLSVRSIPIAASPESTGGTANLLGRAEYYIPYGDTAEPFLMANYLIGKAFCLCAERTDETGSDSIEANFKYIESITVITEKTYDGTIGMAAATLGSDKYPFVINCDAAAGSLRNGSNRVVAIGVKRTGNEREAIKDIKLTTADFGVAYEYLGRSYTRVSEIPVNGMFIYTTKDDGSKDLLSDYIDWRTINPDTTNFKNFDFTKLNWNTAGADFNNNWLPLKDTEKMAKINELKKYQAKTAELFRPDLSAITNIGLVLPDGVNNDIYWAGRASADGAQTVNPITDGTVASAVVTFDGTPCAVKLVYTNAANKSYDDFIIENKKALTSFSASVYTDFNQLPVIIVLSAITLAAVAVALIVGLKRRNKNIEKG